MRPRRERPWTMSRAANRFGAFLWFPAPLSLMFVTGSAPRPARADTRRMIAREPRAVLLSLHPQWATRLVEGEKTVEVRRRAIALQRGDTLFIYASSPVCAVIGRAVVDQVVSASPAALWRSIGGRRTTTLSRAEFDAYLRGVHTACALVLGRAAPLARMITLDELRGLCPGFHPPQTCCDISPGREQVRAIGAALLGARTRVRTPARQCA